MIAIYGKPEASVSLHFDGLPADLRLAQGRPALMFDHEIGATALGSARIVVNYGR